ncbi:MAG: M23 family metallopeptidase [Patescibacteria group bacterium]|nr:M23 family metallopeptidase [Patescibacteria group bacterium]
MPLGGSGHSFPTFRDFIKNQAKIEHNSVEIENVFGKKLALVLYVLKENEKPSALEDYTFGTPNIFPTQSNEVKIIRCIIRIDVIHEHIFWDPQYLQVAKNAQSLQQLRDTSIPQHPIAVAANIGLPPPNVGQFIWVDVIERGSNLLFVYSAGTGSNVLLDPEAIQNAIQNIGSSYTVVLKGSVDTNLLNLNLTYKDKKVNWKTRWEYSDYAIFRPDRQVWHRGLDISNDERGGDPWVSTVNGVVTKSQTSDSYRPFFVVVQAEDGYYHLYGHLSEHMYHVKVGDKVKKGDLIGYTTPKREIEANSVKLDKDPFIPHIHYEILLPKTGGTANPKQPENYLDPLVFLAKGEYQNEKAKRNFKYPIYYNSQVATEELITNALKQIGR